MMALTLLLLLLLPAVVGLNKEGFAEIIVVLVQ